MKDYEKQKNFSCLTRSKLSDSGIYRLFKRECFKHCKHFKHRKHRKLGRF